MSESMNQNAMKQHNAVLSCRNLSKRYDEGPESVVVLDGLDKLGYPTTREERDDLLHLWRWVAYVIGVEDDFRFATEPEARRFWDLLATTQGPPDDDARARVGW